MLQKYGMRRINGNISFVVTFVLASSEIPNRKAQHGQTGRQTLPALSSQGAGGYLDWGINLKSICIH